MNLSSENIQKFLKNVKYNDGLFGIIFSNQNIIQYTVAIYNESYPKFPYIKPHPNVWVFLTWRFHLAFSFYHKPDSPQNSNWSLLVAHSVFLLCECKIRLWLESQILLFAEYHLVTYLGYSTVSKNHFRRVRSKIFSISKILHSYWNKNQKSGNKLDVLKYRLKFFVENCQLWIFKMKYFCWYLITLRHSKYEFGHSPFLCLSVLGTNKNEPPPSSEQLMDNGGSHHYRTSNGSKCCIAIPVLEGPND